MLREIFATTLTVLLASLLLAGCATKSGYTVRPAVKIPSSGQIPIK